MWIPKRASSGNICER